MIHVLIPAHNEASSIANTLLSVKAQTVPVGDVTVLCDNCDDDTALIAAAHDVQVYFTKRNKNRKAGALNQYLSKTLQSFDDTDYVFVMDADSRLAPQFIQEALQELVTNPSAGAVCGSFAGEPDRNGFIHVLQRNEYARFSRTISRRNAVAQVLSGVASLFPVRVLKEVKNARRRGDLPKAPGIYEVTCATEDIEMTMAVTKLGYTPTSPKGCLVFTDTLSTWRGLAHQRVRWQRGMLDALRLYGLNKKTLPYILRLAGMYLGSMFTLLYIFILFGALTLYRHIEYNPFWLLILPIFALERWWTIRRLSWRESLVALTLIPEWFYENYRAAVYWGALFGWLKGTKRKWIPT